MTRIRRRRLAWTIIRIVLFTMLALIVERYESLGRIEAVLYDLRALFCQRNAPPPTDKLVHLDIDEIAINQIGRWPWDREKLAEILDEIRLAGPKVLAMDLLFSEPEKVTYDQAGHKIDPDAKLVEAIRKSENVLAPISLTFYPMEQPRAVDRALMSLLTENPNLTVEQCEAQLQKQGLLPPGFDITQNFTQLRPQAIYNRIDRELEAGLINPAQIKQKVLSHGDTMMFGPVERLFDEQYTRAVRERSQRRFSIPAKEGMPPMLEGSDPIVPILSVSEAARYGAFVDYLPDMVDGTVRSVPLTATYRGKVMPHLGLATACAMLDVDVKNIQITADTVTIPLPDGRKISIPVQLRQTRSYGPIGTFMEIPLFGKKDRWQTMYDYPAHRVPAKHVSLYEIWRIIETSRYLAKNEALADASLEQAMGIINPEAAAAYHRKPLRGDDQKRVLDATLGTTQKMEAGLAKETDLEEDDKKLLALLRKVNAPLKALSDANAALRVQRDHLRAEVREKLNGRAAFIGGLGTGHVDMVPTCLHAGCPGVVVHGAIFNAIMTGKMWRVAPKYWTYAVIIAIGLLTGILVSGLSPFRALLGTVLICCGYLAINGFILFDRHDLILGLSGPLLVAALVWSGVTVPNFIREVAQRKHITARFSNYVDPALVNYVIDHPEHARFDGESREMTMGFTDLAGFTTLTETLGPRTVPLLNEYMGLMIPKIRLHRGYVSRLMGDGIYFFYNAPGIDKDHAAHAICTVLDMHTALAEFNLTLPARGLPALQMRAGICTGRVIVGDAGSAEFSDFTALGDSVNSAARFESANKIFGTRIMASARTIELIGDRFLVRPIANLRVAGKTLGVQVYEPICRIELATAAEKQLAEISADIVKAYQAGEFAKCIEAADLLEQGYGRSKFAELYRTMAKEFQVQKPEDFDGQVVLTEK